MTVKIGVIGTGNIGTDHVNRLAGEISGADVVAVFDVDSARAQEVGARVGAVAHASASQVIEDAAVNAVVIASPGHLHPEQVIACIHAGKPVMCEKPLATTTQACFQVLDAEAAFGRQLVQIGFMRRYDEAYGQVKSALDSGAIGEALLLHCVHRNPTVPPSFQEFMAITDSVVHEIDTSRWLLGEEIMAVSVRSGKRSRHATGQDPQMVTMETASGVLIDVESFVNCQYGYDVRCELVGSEGYATLDNPRLSTVTRTAQRINEVPADWRVRFGAAYRAEFQAWLAGIETGVYTGATAWDGYAATAVADAGVRALETRLRVEVELIEKPAFYEKAGTS
jgi:myo-inositol 2-dehydrogenase/D-chiro-inositol 1-dehydrogenase